MCGRYLYYFDKDDEDIQRLVSKIDNNMVSPKIGEIFPTNYANVIVQNVLTTLKWGFILNNNKLIINARSETIDQKPLFRKAFLSGKRCLIPAYTFFEWKKTSAKKIKFAISSLKVKTFFMAGLYNNFIDPSGQKTFNYVILTGAANQYIYDIHNRMPIIIESLTKQNIWLNKNSEPEELKKIIHNCLDIELNPKSIP